VRTRAGTWVIAIALCAIVVVQAVTLAVVDLTTVLTGDTEPPWPLVVLRYAADVGLVTGAIMLAIETRWVAIAALAAAAPLFDTFVPYADAGTAIAAGVIVHALDIFSRRLSITTYVLAALSIAALFLGWFIVVTQLAVCALACYVAFYKLEAFPDDTDRPVARIASRTRTGVTAASYAFCLVGLALLALVVWQHRNVGTIDGQALVGGVGAFIGGAVALRRLHMEHTRVRNAVALVITISVLTLVFLNDLRPRPDKVPLVAHEAFGVRVSLPVGYVVNRTDTELEIRPTLAKFGPVKLRAHRGRMPEETIVRFGYTGSVDDGDTGVHVRWTCHPTFDWIELEIVFHGVNTFNSSDHDYYLKRLVKRIEATFSCVR
jgi:hypothetical protein